MKKNLLLRISQQVEKSKGFEKPKDPGASYYPGSRQKIFLRYKYSYKNLLQFGFSGDKDAGEQFFRGHQKLGFDFYSFHLFLRNAGIVKSLAIGDFTVNLGQGLIQWQTQAFTKSADVLAIKRQSTELRPYNSAGEFYFHRGAGITLERHHWMATVFISYKKISASLDEDTLDRQAQITSFQDGGYHRTAAENDSRNNTGQFAGGGGLHYRQPNYQAGVNVVAYHFSRPVQKKEEPYNFYALSGQSWFNASFDYSATLRNLHFFGEWALDRNRKTAWIQGLLLSLCASTDLSIIYRNINKAYQSLYSNAFTENATPSNEQGIYWGLSVRPSGAWKIMAFFDQYQFPWLKYQVAAPSHGNDYLLQLVYQPGRKWNMAITYKSQLRQYNAPGNGQMHLLEAVPKKDCRVDMAFQVNRKISVKSRVEILWYAPRSVEAEQGFLGSFDLFYRPSRKPLSFNLRLQYFETDGYDSRIYAFENGALYNYSLPEFSGRGFRYYFNAGGKIRKRIHIYKYRPGEIEWWCRWSQTIYPSNLPSIGSGLDEISGHKKSDILFQILIHW